MTHRIDRYVYRETDVLGAGQYGKVFKGTTTDTNELVAIKVIPHHMLQNHLFQNMFKNEIESLKMLNSPFIVKLLDIKSHNNNLYLITEFCDGGDLGDYLSKRKRLTEEEVIDIAYQVTQAYKEMKKLNLLHRDLKPANILIQNGLCKVADLGFSKHVQDFGYSLARSYVGSPIYMSPQVLFKQQYTSKADCWSLGIMLYQLLYGVVPWTATDINELSFQIRNHPIVFQPGVPISPELADLISRCCRFEERGRISWDEIFSHPVMKKSNLYQQEAAQQVQIPQQPQQQIVQTKPIAQSQPLPQGKQPSFAQYGNFPSQQFTQQQLQQQPASPTLPVQQPTPAVQIPVQQPTSQVGGSPYRGPAFQTQVQQQVPQQIQQPQSFQAGSPFQQRTTALTQPASPFQTFNGINQAGILMQNQNQPVYQVSQPQLQVGQQTLHDFFKGPNLTSQFPAYQQQARQINQPQLAAVRPTTMGGFGQQQTVVQQPGLISGLQQQRPNIPQVTTIPVNQTFGFPRAGGFGAPAVGGFGGINRVGGFGYGF